MKIRLHERDWKRGGRAVLFALAAIVALYFFWTTGHLVMAFQEQKRAHIFPRKILPSDGINRTTRSRRIFRISLRQARSLHRIPLSSNSPRPRLPLLRRAERTSHPYPHRYPHPLRRPRTQVRHRPMRAHRHLPQLRHRPPRFHYRSSNRRRPITAQRPPMRHPLPIRWIRRRATQRRPIRL